MEIIKKTAKPVLVLHTDRLCTGVVNLLAAGYVVVVSQQNGQIVMELYNK